MRLSQLIQQKITQSTTKTGGQSKYEEITKSDVIKISDKVSRDSARNLINKEQCICEICTCG